MLNKRVKTLLTLVLVGAMVMSEPAASWAAADKAVEEDSQLESKKSDTQDSEEEEKTESGKTDKKEDTSKKKKKKVSGNSTSSDKVSGGQVILTKALSKAKAAPAEEEDEEEKKEDKKKSESKTDDLEEKNALLTDEEDVQAEDVDEEEVTSEEEVSEEGHATFGENPFQISGGDKGSDYSYDSATGVLTVSTNKSLTISGTVEDGSTLSVNSPQGASLSLNGLHIAAVSANAAINVGGSGNVQIYLGGDSSHPNVLTSAGSSIRVNGGATVTIDGQGVLSGNAVNGTVTIKGGNIQAAVPNARSVSGNQLVQYKVTGLSANTLYQVSMNSVPGMNGSYANEVCADSNGSVALYLPAGYQAVANGRTLVVSAVPSPSGSPAPSPSVSPSPSPTTTPTSDTPDIASADDNGLYWIDAGKTYRSGATLQFYATGAGYGPDEPQELNPVDNSTRYIPVDWRVSTTSSSVSGNSGSTSGKWTEYSEETTGNTTNEYRYKASFVLNTTGTSSVPYTLQVNYQKQTYDGADGAWRDDGSTVSKSVNFYIRNTTATVTPTSRPTTYVRSTVTTSAVRNSVSSNARNASTGDETPIGTLVLLLLVAAASGVAVFRKKRIGR